MKLTKHRATVSALDVDALFAGATRVTALITDPADRILAFEAPEMETTSTGSRIDAWITCSNRTFTRSTDRWSVECQMPVIVRICSECMFLHAPDKICLDSQTTQLLGDACGYWHDSSGFEMRRPEQAQELQFFCVSIPFTLQDSRDQSFKKLCAATDSERIDIGTSHQNLQETGLGDI